MNTFIEPFVTSAGKAPVALVTGSSRGLGRAIALDLARAGCQVAVNYVSSAEAANEVVACIKASDGDAAPFRADVGNPEEVSTLISAVHERFSQIDILVNNAGIAPRLDLFETNVSNFDAVMAANVRSAYLMSQSVLGGMKARRWGRLVFLSSMAARTGGVISAPYAASKAAVEGLMHYYASQLLTHHVTANAVSPAFIETDIFKDAPGPALATMPLERFGRPEEVAAVVRMLVTTEYITGQTIQISAGRYHT